MYSIIALIHGGDAWLGLLYLMILAIPFSFGVFQWRKRTFDASKLSLAGKLGSILFALQGATLACWAYDLATTFYAINVARIATEINPLGWPLGALGALSYYVPTVVLSYVLIFRLKAKVSLYAAIPITVVALFMGSMNLNAGMGNFTFFIWTTSVSGSVGYDLMTLVVAVDFAFAAVLAFVSRGRVIEMRRTRHLQGKL